MAQQGQAQAQSQALPQVDPAAQAFLNIQLELANVSQALTTQAYSNLMATRKIIGNGLSP